MQLPRISFYLNFPDQSEEAMRSYAKTFRVPVKEDQINRFGDMPPVEGMPPLSDEVKNLILHTELEIFPGVFLMFSDAPKEMGFTITQGNNMHINVEPETREETERIFNELSAGGTVTQALEVQFWGALFGSVTDRYGINWMVNFTLER